MSQMGHTSPSVALALYAEQMDRRDRGSERLRALAEGVDWASTGTQAAAAMFKPSERATAYGETL